jgi:glycerol-3-phosphate dehydrogenase
VKSRAEAIESIAEKHFDVCVIGGGATGSACALDAQLRGFNTVLLDAGDFASVTSSTSTKMAHGGVRYLEEAITGLDPKEYAVLKRALHERIHMLRNAPYLTRTKLFITPCFSWFQVLYLEIGLKLYDWIAGQDRLARSHFISRKEALERIPALAAEKIVGGVVYADGQFDDARYNLALVKTFAKAGGEPLNYARVVRFAQDGTGKITGVEVQDQVSRRVFAIYAGAFVNATGPHADALRQMASPGIAPRMRTSKGVHILLPLDVLSSEDAMLIPKTDDGRVLFAIPWFGRLLVGTTDDEVRPDDELYVKREEVEYLLRYLNKYLQKPVAPDQILSGTAGARPLVSSGESTDTRKLARDHQVEFDPSSGLVSILGGKWTTHRAMAEDTINEVQKKLGGAYRPCTTLSHSLAGSEGYADTYWQSLAGRFGISETTARHLAQKFGTQADRVMEIETSDPYLGQPIVPGAPPILAEVVFAAREEMAATIEDVLARRIGLQLWSWKDAIRAAPSVGALLGRELGWSDEQTRTAVDQYVAKIHDWMQKSGIGWQ